MSLLINKKRVTHPHGQATHNNKQWLKCNAAAAADVELLILITWNANIKNISNISISFISGQIIKVVWLIDIDM